MQLENRGNGSWRVTIQEGLNPDGSQNRFRKIIKVDPKKSVSVQRKEVEKQAALIVADYERKLITGSKKVTFQELAQEFMNDHLARRKPSPSTVKSYEFLINGRMTAYFEKKCVQDITPRDINKFYNSLDHEAALSRRSKSGKLSGTTKQHYHSLLFSIMSFAVKMGYISVNPVSQVESPKRDTTETQWYEPEQAAQLLNVLDQLPDIQWKTYFYTAIYTGMRPGEMVGLNWSDIEGNMIHINATAVRVEGVGTVRKNSPKTKAGIRSVTLPPIVCNLLKQHKLAQAEYRLQFGENWPDPEAVFTTKEGKRMDIDSPTHKFQKILKENNLPKITLYGLRHTNATILIASGVSIRDVSAHLGHAQTSTTMDIYAHALRDAEEKTASAFDQAMNAARKKA